MSNNAHVSLTREYDYDRTRFVALVQPEERGLFYVTSPSFMTHELSEMSSPALLILADNIIYKLKLTLADFPPPACNCKDGYLMGDPHVSISMYPCPEADCIDFADRIQSVTVGKVEVASASAEPLYAIELEQIIKRRVENWGTRYDRTKVKR